MTNETKPATDEQVQAWIELEADGRLFIPAHVIDSLVARIASDAEIIKAREAAYESAQEGLRNARKQEAEMRETIRNHESQARDARVYIATLEAERVALRAQVETLREALAEIAEADVATSSEMFGPSREACADLWMKALSKASAILAATEPKG